MNIYYIREFWFDDFYDGSGNVQRATITWTDFQQQNIKVTAQLNVFDPARISVSITTILLAISAMPQSESSGMSS